MKEKRNIIYLILWVLLVSAQNPKQFQGGTFFIDGIAVDSLSIFNGDLIPEYDTIHSIGSDSLRFNRIYVDTVTSLQVAGFGSYIDTTFTTSNRFAVTGGVITNLPQRGGITNNSLMPYNMTSFLDVADSMIVPRSIGDIMIITIGFTAHTLASNNFIDFVVAADGDILYSETQAFVKGPFINNRFNFQILAPVRQKFKDSGATAFIVADKDCDIWDIKYKVYVH